MRAGAADGQAYPPSDRQKSGGGPESAPADDRAERSLPRRKSAGNRIHLEKGHAGRKILFVLYYISKVYAKGMKNKQPSRFLGSVLLLCRVAKNGENRYRFFLKKKANGV